MIVRLFSLLLTLLLVALAFSLAIANPENLGIRFFPFDASIHMWTFLWLFLIFLIGLISGAFYHSLSKRNYRKALKTAQKRIITLEIMLGSKESDSESDNFSAQASDIVARKLSAPRNH